MAKKVRTKTHPADLKVAAARAELYREGIDNLYFVKAYLLGMQFGSRHASQDQEMMLGASIRHINNAMGTLTRLLDNV